MHFQKWEQNEMKQKLWHSHNPNQKESKTSCEERSKSLLELLPVELDAISLRSLRSCDVTTGLFGGIGGGGRDVMIVGGCIGGGGATESGAVTVDKLLVVRGFLSGGGGAAFGAGAGVAFWNFCMTETIELPFTVFNDWMIGHVETVVVKLGPLVLDVDMLTIDNLADEYAEVFEPLTLEEVDDVSEATENDFVIRFGLTVAYEEWVEDGGWLWLMLFSVVIISFGDGSVDSVDSDPVWFDLITFRFTIVIVVVAPDDGAVMVDAVGLPVFPLLVWLHWLFNVWTALRTLSDRSGDSPDKLLPALPGFELGALLDSNRFLSCSYSRVNCRFIDWASSRRLRMLSNSTRWSDASLSRSYSICSDRFDSSSSPSTISATLPFSDEISFSNSSFRSLCSISRTISSFRSANKLVTITFSRVFSFSKSSFTLERSSINFCLSFSSCSICATHKSLLYRSVLSRSSSNSLDTSLNRSVKSFNWIRSCCFAFCCALTISYNAFTWLQYKLVWDCTCIVVSVAKSVSRQNAMNGSWESRCHWRLASSSSSVVDVVVVLVVFVRSTSADWSSTDVISVDPSAASTSGWSSLDTSANLIVA